MKDLGKQKAVLIEAAKVWMKWLHYIYQDRDIASKMIHWGFTFPCLSLNEMDFYASPFHRGMMFRERMNAIVFLIDHYGEIPYATTVSRYENDNMKRIEAEEHLWGAMCRILYDRSMYPGHKAAANKYFPIK